MRIFLLMVVAFMAAAPPAAEQGVRSGIAAWGRGDYAGALAAWRPLAERGNADAMFNLGQAYRLGRGVAIDLGQAMQWYTKAAEAGHVDAQTQLGILLFQNGNQLSGLRWLHAAADKGEPRAELLYGTALFNGDGLVRRDPEAAYGYVARAAAQGLAPAKATLAELDKSVPPEMRQRALASVVPGARTASGRDAAQAPAGRIAGRPKAPAATLPKAVVSAQALAGGGGWRVQLGAFGQRAAAEALFRKFAGGPLSGKQPVLVPVGAMTRLQAGPYASRAEASAACSALAARGQPCFVVAAR